MVQLQQHLQQQYMYQNLHKTKAKVEADYQLAQRLQAQEQEELTDEEKARLFVQFLEQRRKHFSAKRAEEKRNRPPTRAQQRSIMCTYLKNMEGWKPKSLKNKSFANIQKLFENAMKRVNTFVDYRTELLEESSKKAETKLEENLKKAEVEVMEGSSKRAVTELEQEVTKKKKVDDVQETAEVDDVQETAKVDDDQEPAKIKELIEIIPDEEEVAIDAIPLAVKEDLETLWKLVKAKHGSTRPEEGYERVIWGNLKVTFEPHVEDTVWRNQQDYRLLDWKIYDSYGVHSLRMQHMHIHMLVEKKYPLTPATITDMLNKKLQGDHFSEMVGCQICEGPHLDKDCPLNEEVKQVEEVRYGELGRTTPFNRNNEGRLILAETIKKYIEEASMRQVKQDEWLKTFCHNLKKSQNLHDEIIKGLRSRVTTLAKKAVTMTDKNEDCKAIFTNDGAPLYTLFYYSPEEIK
ncbi:hypothetical protein Tco_0256290 [Tanacetum coccineum]